MKRLLIPGILAFAALPSHAALIAAYTFDETSGTTATDSVRGATGNATLTGTAGFSAGKIGNALTLDGTANAWASALNPVINNQAQLSISAWVNATTLTAWSSIVKDWTDGAATFHFGLNSDPTKFSGFIAPANTSVVSSGSALTSATWYHAALVFDDTADTMKIYINGSLAGTTTGLSTTHLSNGGSATAGNLMAIGASNNGTERWSGKIDDLAFYDNVLTASDITTLYNNGLSGISAVPEPSTYGLIGAGALAAVALVRRRRKLD